MTEKAEKRKRELLAFARGILEEEGIKALSMRALSEKSGTSVGTVYLYFKSKNELVASLVLEDWYKEVERAKLHMMGKTQAYDRAKVLYESLISFGAAHIDIWASYPRNLAAIHLETDFHTMMINQMREAFGLDRFTIEVLLHYSFLSDQTFCDISCKLKKLLCQSGECGSSNT